MNDKHPASAAKTIQFWFDFGSNYSYLSAMRIEEAAARHGVRVVWKPFLLGPIFRSFGWEASPFVLQKEKGEYVWQDMVRLCRKYGLPWKKPGTFPRNAMLAHRVALLASDKPWIGEFCQQIMRLNFAFDQDIGSEAVVREVLRQLGQPADEVVAAAQSDANKQRLREQTEAAKAKGIFGAPTFFVGDEMYWGNDRLDDALEDAAAGGGA